MKHPTTRNILLVLAIFGAALWLTRQPIVIWDARDQLWLSRWIFETVTFQWLWKSVPRDIQIVTWYGPLWEGFTGILGHGLLGWLNDPIWVKNAATLALLPVTLLLLYRGLRRLGWTRLQAALALALLLGCVRWVGHSLFNTKDFPFACAYIVVSVWLIARLRNPQPTRAWFWGTTYLSLVPLLLRPPVAVHFAFFLFWRAWNAYRSSGSKAGLKVALTTAGAGFVATFSMWPAMWRSIPRDWINGILMFRKFPVVFSVRYFGVDGLSDQLPWYYPWIWVPVDYTPLAFVTLVVGIGICLLKLTKMKGFLYSDRALATLMILPWVALFAQRPSLYDEDRHVLFALVSLAVLAAIGLRHINTRLQAGLVATLLIWTGVALAEWREYSYVYKSSLIGSRLPDRFMGDYWGVCVNELIQRISREVHRPDTFYVDLPGPVLEEMQNRAAYSRVGHDPLIQAFGTLHPLEIGYNGPVPGHYLGFRRNVSGLEAQMARARNGEGRVRMEIPMPGGQAACAWIEF